MKDLEPIIEEKKKIQAQLGGESVAPKSKQKKIAKVQKPVTKDASPSGEWRMRWYVFDENKTAYLDRRKKVTQRVQFQLRRISRATRNSAVAYDAVYGGIFNLRATEAGRRIPSKKASNGIQPMPKQWLPPGVTRE